MKRIFAFILVLILIFLLPACGRSNSNVADGSNNTSSDDFHSIAVCLGGEPDTLDPALNSSAYTATITLHLFSGLAKWEKKDDGTLEITADVAKELPDGIENEDGTVTYVYTLRDDVRWSDGKSVTASDFVFAWQRAASPELAGTYNNMFDVIVGYDDMWKLDGDGRPKNPDAKLAVKALDDIRLEVTLCNAVPYWNELLAFPVFLPVREDIVTDDSWAHDPESYICNGAYTITDWQHDSVITLEKNPYYFASDNITMDKIEFFLSNDANNMLINYLTGNWQMIEDVPINEIQRLREQYPDEFVVTGQIGTYFAFWNINEDILPVTNKLSDVEAEKASAEIRSAINLLFDRNFIVEHITQSGQVAASSFVPMGLTDFDGTEFYKSAGHNDTFVGYYDVRGAAQSTNYSSAMETLKKYYIFDDETQTFVNFPTITYTYNSGDSHTAIAEYLQAVLSGIGITLNLESLEWGTFTGIRQSGNYCLARNGIRADYNDPMCFLDLWVSTSTSNDIQFGRGKHASLAAYDLDLTPYGYDIQLKDCTWAETYDVLVDTIKACRDSRIRYQLMHEAEDLLMSTGCIMPIYFYTDLLMISSDVNGFYCNPFGHKYFMYCKNT